MKFLEAIDRKLMMLEQGEVPPDAAMPQSPDATPAPTPVSVPTPQQTDDSGDAMQEQVSANIKLCADAINALVVFVRGKFSDTITATPGLDDQFKKLEDASRVTDVSTAQLPLLNNIVTLVTNIKGI